MWLFDANPKLLQDSMASSMQYIYRDSNAFPNTSNPLSWLLTPASETKKFQAK